MNRLTLSLLLLLVGFSTALNGQALHTLYVSPKGNDTAPGTQEAPFATLEKARIGAQALREKGERVEVVLMDGEYRLSSPVCFSSPDSGEVDAPVVWRAQNLGQVIVSGMAPLVWRVPTPDEAQAHGIPESVRTKLLVATMPGTNDLPSFAVCGCGAKSKMGPLSVFSGGKRCKLACWPKTGWTYAGRFLNAEKSYFIQGVRVNKCGLFAYSNPILKQLAQEKELWAFGLWWQPWADMTSRVLAVDPEKQTVEVDLWKYSFGFKDGAEFRFLNVFSMLAEPGFWAQDTRARTIWIHPYAPQDRLQVTWSSSLIKVNKAHDIVFDGIGFEGARDSAILLNASTRICLEACAVRHTSSWGITIWDGLRCRVTGCDLDDLGEGGIRLHGGSQANIDFPTRNVAENNHVSNWGRRSGGVTGLSVSGVGNIVRHNLVHHSDSGGISFGGNDHYIGYNIVHDTAQYNDDCGAIYTCQRDWTKRGTVIEYNFVHAHGIQPTPQHTPGIYLDDYSSGVIVRGNVVSRTGGGITVGGGNGVTVERNVVLMSPQYGIQLASRGIETFAKHLVIKGTNSPLLKKLLDNRARYLVPPWKDRYPHLLDPLQFSDPFVAHNAMWNTYVSNAVVGCAQMFSKSNWKMVKDYTTDIANRAWDADPGFANAAQGDFALKPGTEIAALVGDMHFAEMGLEKNVRRFSPAVRFGDNVYPFEPIHKCLVAASVDVLVTFPKLPAGITNCAVDTTWCTVPAWSHGWRVSASYGRAKIGRWQEYTFSFTPTFDATIDLSFCGGNGEKTYYDGISVTGAELKNGDFEMQGGWFKPCHFDKHPADRLGKFGIVGPTGTLKPFSGVKMSAANAGCWTRQRIAVKSGVPVTVTFHAAGATRESPSSVTRERIHADLAHVPATHPRLFANASDFEALRDRAQKDAFLQSAVARVCRDADEAIVAPPLEHKLKGIRLLSVARTCLRQVVNGAMAYKLTGEAKYRNAVLRTVNEALSFPDWNPRHFLDTAEFSLAIAIAYDWLYNDLTSEDRTHIAKRLLTLGLEPSFKDKLWWIQGKNNWTSVCHAGEMAAAFALKDVYPDVAERVIHRAVTNLSRPAVVLAPNGNYPEGPGYWIYGVGFHVLDIDLLERNFGFSYGLGDIEGWQETATYLDNLTGPSGKFFNYSDGGMNRGACEYLWWFAKRYNRPEILLANELKLRRELISGKAKASRLNALSLLWYLPVSEKGRNTLPIVWNAEGVAPVTVQRSSWNTNAFFVALKAGTPSENHGHMDAGSFVLDAQGIRWAYDLGAENYNQIESRGMNLWDNAQSSDRWRVYRLSTQAHNTLMLDGCAQRVKGFAKVVSCTPFTANEPSRSVIDLSDIYTNATTVMRTGTLFADGKQYLLADVVQGLRPTAPIRWAMMTRATVERQGNDLILHEGDKYLRLVQEGGAWPWQVIEEPCPNEWDTPNKGYRQLFFEVPASASGTTSFAIRFITIIR